MALFQTLQAQPQASDCSECRTVLAGGVFNSTNINQTQSAKTAFAAWQCSAEFGSHDEAIGAGIAVGVPIYGVPIQIGGTFSDSERSQWKSTNCSASSNSAQSFQLLVVAMREANPAILAAWTRCIEIACGPNRAGLACAVTPTAGGGIFRASWVRNTGDNSAPKVQYYKAYDATCSPNVAVNSTISEAGVAVNCQVPVNKEAVFILQTTRGTCTPTLSGLISMETLAGRVSLTAERNYKAQKIVFNSDTVIVTNGKRLTIEADEVVLQGAPKIVSYEQTAPSSGLSAGPVIIKARKLSGTSLIIENIGQSGVRGSPGAAGAKGSKGGQGTQRDWNAFNGCIGGSNGGQGGRGGDGGDGAQGGTGGNGGSVIFDVQVGLKEGAIDRLVISTAGGLGGEGGAPGPAGPGGDGGDAAPGTTWCGGTSPGPMGPAGNPGRKGPTGAQGASGPIVNYHM